MKSHILILTNHGYAPLLARLVPAGDGFGRNFRLISNEALVEFYDTRYPHTEFGQFISRYTLDTILALGPKGIALDGGIPYWTLAQGDSVRLQSWLKQITAAAPVASLACEEVAA